jgi:Sulfotransferase domain
LDGGLVPQYQIIASAINPAKQVWAPPLQNGPQSGDNLEESALRRQLDVLPGDLGLTYSLVALLHRNARAPVPDRDTEALDSDADIDEAGLDLLRIADEYAHKGDTYGVYAALWQVVVRYPQSVRGWAEFARAFANRAEWAHCRLAMQRAFTLKTCRNSAAADILLQALGTLAEYKQLGDLRWREWIGRHRNISEIFPGTVQLLLRSGDTIAAATIAPKSIDRWPERADAWVAAAKVEYEFDRLSNCYNYFCRALELDLRGVLQTIIRDFSSQFAATVEELAKESELADRISEQSRGDDVNLIPPWPTPESLLAVRNLRSKAIERGLPSALLISQAKAATVTVGNIFSSGFQLPTALYSIVNVRVVESWLENFMLGGASYVTHLRPTEQNIELLRKGGAKNVIVHVRDPRQQLISLIHHHRRYPEQLAASKREILTKNDDNEVFRYVMDEIFVPTTIWWIDNWYKARDKLGLKFTTFEEFIRDRRKFAEKIVSLYGGNTRYFDQAIALGEHAGIDYHKRLGAIDEWRIVLNPKQVDEVNSAIPGYFWDAFGWTP